MSYVNRAVRTLRTMSPHEQARLLKVSGEHVAGFRDHMIFSVALGTALRESEIAALNVGDVARGPTEIRSRVQLKVFAQKGPKPAGDTPASVGVQKRQQVFLPKVLRRKLVKFLAWKKRNGELVGPLAPLFVVERADRSQRIALRTLRHVFREWQKRAKIETLYSFHELRHTALTNLYRNTRDILRVQRLARHVDVATSQIYAHVSDQEMRDSMDDLPC